MGWAGGGTADKRKILCCWQNIGLIGGVSLKKISWLGQMIVIVLFVLV